MPWSQITSMNCSPPRAMAADRLAALPSANGRMRNRRRLNIGPMTVRSLTRKAISAAMPRANSDTTSGLVHAISLVP